MYITKITDWLENYWDRCRRQQDFHVYQATVSAAEDMLTKFQAEVQRIGAATRLTGIKPDVPLQGANECIAKMRWVVNLFSNLPTLNGTATDWQKEKAAWMLVVATILDQRLQEARPPAITSTSATELLDFALRETCKDAEEEVRLLIAKAVHELPVWKYPAAELGRALVPCGLQLISAPTNVINYGVRGGKRVFIDAQFSNW